LGDSITRGWETRGAAVLADLRKQYSILPLGIGGDRVQHVIWRVRYGELDGFKTKCIMLMIGTNNNYGDKPEATALGIKNLLSEIRAKQPEATILLVPVFPRGEQPTDPKRINNANVNALIKGFADGKHVIWVDFNSRLVRPDGTISKDLMPDFLHPRVEGYRIWAETALPYFKAACGK
jgi:beta-glucosidase